MALIKCSECGHEISDKATICPHCGAVNPMNVGAASNGNPMHQTIIVRQESKKSNGAGTAGFVLSILGFVFSWVPFLGWILWLLGLIFSFVGVLKAPRGLAIAGLCITFISLIILIVFVGALAAIFTFSY
ncbi:zinc ribbon domain-containing protein [Bacteroides ilei]|uniref:zinc ribbon domain-containing protein n=1 Tax=Bacteroides ilei TaxID=1907658 RepID=UPI0009FA329D|nr:zinc ribbon domain-containing protein [Bacteroides ilei]